MPFSIMIRPGKRSVSSAICVMIPTTHRVQCSETLVDENALELQGPRCALNLGAQLQGEG